MNIRTSAFRGLAILSLSVLGLAACDDKEDVITPPPVQNVSVTVTPAAVTLEQGQTAALVAVVSGTSNQAVTWTSSNAAVATVSSAGVVTAVAPGVTTILATSQADANARSASVVTVTARPAVGITILPSTATIAIGGTVQLQPNVTGTTNTAVTYRSGTPAVATVSAAGVVTGVSAGTSVITAIAAADTTKKAFTTVTVTGGPAPTISITPSQASINVGGTQQFTATVSGTTNTAVTYRSSTPAVATITSAGLATGVAAGTTVITAISAADTTIRATATLTVAQLTQPSISIQNVVSQITGLPVAQGAAVAGVVTVTMNVSAGTQTNIGRVEVQANGQTACTQTFNPPLAPTQGVATITCPINTALLNGTTPVFPNGIYEITAVAYPPSSNTAAATATFGNLNFQNANVIAVNMTTTPVSSATGSAIGGATSMAPGLLWNEGDLVVTGAPILYSGGSVATATVCLNIPVASAAAGSNTGTPCRTMTLADGVWTATFPKSRTPTQSNPGVAGVENSAVTATITTTTAAGTVGPTNFNGLRLDNWAPRVTNFAGPNAVYINDAFTFNTAARLTTVDAGVDSETETLDIVLASTLGDASATVATGGAGVTNASGVAESQTNQQYALRVVTTDALGNSRTMYATTVAATPSTFGGLTAQGGANVAATFGVDRTAPQYRTVAGAQVSSMSNNSEDQYTGTTTVATINYQDTSTDPNAGPSGFAPTPVRVRLIRYWSVDTNGRCIDPRDGTTVVNNTVNSRDNTATPNPTNTPTDPDASATGCYFWTDGTVTLPPGDTHAGYYVMDATVFDLAGNQSAEINRSQLRDANAPTVGAISVPTSITGGQTASFSALMTDDVELGSNTVAVGYQGGAAMWLRQGVTALAAEGHDPLTFSLVHTQTVDQFIRSLTLSSAAGVPQQGTQDDADLVAFQTRDMVAYQDNDACALLAAGDNAVGVNCTSRQSNIQPAILVGLGGNAMTNWAQGGPVMDAGSVFLFPGSAATRCNGDDAGGTQATPCPTNSTSTVSLSATLTGNAQTFVNPFQRVEFYVRLQGTEEWILLGTSTGVSVVDNQQTLTRTYTYSGPAFSAAGRTAGVYDFVAIGVRSNGDALVSAMRATITVAVD